MLDSIKSLKELLSGFPGIGNKSALKLALYLIQMNKEQLSLILNQIRESNEKIKVCDQCKNFCESNPCPDCVSPFSEQGIICVVEQAMDALFLKDYLPEGSKFHVLGGKLSPLNGISPEGLHINLLLKRLTDPQIKEIILATGADIEGEATATYLAEIIKQKFSTKISRTAYGVSAGSSFSSSDERSIQKSILGRIFY